MLKVQRTWEDARRVNGLGEGTKQHLMSNSRGQSQGHSQRSRTSSDADQAGRNNSPLVIVSEQGRHSDAQRRVVRAQAARASAAQSRVTRARNREERDGPTKEVAKSPEAAEFTRRREDVTGANIPASDPTGLTSPTLLKGWLNDTLSSSGIAIPPPSQFGSSSPPSTTSNIGILPRSGVDGQANPQILLRRQLPLALPRGFTSLQQRIPIADSLLNLISRTACFDFGSPGIEQRLQQRLFELISTPLQLGHPIQSFFRLACVCLTIYQGQRADGAQLAYDARYTAGLNAAWSEAASLDERALEPKCAEASLWSVYMICVTAGSDGARWHHILAKIMEDLQLRQWEQVRRILLEFIYPVSLLDEPCKRFYLRWNSA